MHYIYLSENPMKAKAHFTAVFEPAEEGGYIAYIPEIPGINTQGETLVEAKHNLKDAFLLAIRMNRELFKPKKSVNKNFFQEPFELVHV